MRVLQRRAYPSGLSPPARQSTTAVAELSSPKSQAKCRKCGAFTLEQTADKIFVARFEKSLYDLIQGLRKHKGNEREYIQSSLRECRKEIKSQDMNVKATALLKLTYLEMFGYDMSWAAFNVLEVMSSQNYVQKKVGYLAAIQSFRPDTDVLLLAENLLKKDLTSPIPIVISLPLTAIPHVINPTMANAVLSDLLPRLTHSHAAIRKKTIVTLYRLALVYPETLRPAWPKIKERLLDENEDASVTSAIVNVICELGWRRPQDFLPLAPRLFDLLVQGNNNWMAIKIIKLFATLTPLEPRLIKKLLPPLTNIMKTTPAMSLLYECINGIVQGGILNGAEGTSEGEEIARLCVSKLRSMLVVEGDPNLKYVALLAFQKIVTSHPHLVSLHQDVILECIDDGDISIRMRALDLVVGMVNSENITTIVERLLRQLKNAPAASAVDDPMNDRGAHEGIVPMANDSDDEAEASLRKGEQRSDQPPPLPEEYRVQVLRNILDMCSRDTYANISDFEWYIEVLVQLVRACPTVASSSQHEEILEIHSQSDISSEIGRALRDVAVRVKAMRPDATIAAQNLILIDQRDALFPPFGNGGQEVLGYAAWMVGEYTDNLTNPDGVLDSLLDSSSSQLPARILSIYIHAVLKVFARLGGNERLSWTSQRKTHLTLSMAKIVHFLEPLSTHPDLEVQERAVEYLELMKLSSEAASGHAVSHDGEFQEPPLLLTQAIPSLFTGMELNPVAVGAQRKVPPPEGLDLSAAINENLDSILQEAEEDNCFQIRQDDFETFYNQRMESVSVPEAAADRLAVAEKEQASYSYQNTSEDDVDLLAKRKTQRRERNQDDPFYIGGRNENSASAKLDNIIRSNNNDDLDIDSIPIMNLDLNDNNRPASRSRVSRERVTEAERRRKSLLRKNFEIASDENLGEDEPKVGSYPGREPVFRAKKSLLEVDSSGLGALSLEGGGHESRLDIEQRAEEERALREVERLRLEMQRASERIQAKEESTIVRKKKKKVAKPKEAEDVSAGAGPADDATEAPVVKKKKKKIALAEGGSETVAAGAEGEAVAKPKRKKKRQIDLTSPPG